MKFLPTLLPALLAVTSAAGYKLTPRRIPTPHPHAPSHHHHPSPARHKTCVLPPLPSGHDAAPSILAAAKRCNNGGTILFPAGRTYTVGTALDLTWLHHVDLDLQGTLEFSDDVDYWKDNAFPLTFQNATTFWMLGGEDVNLYGGGTLDGNGQVWYDAYAEDIYILRPILMGIVGLKGGSVSGIHMRYSPQWFNIVVNSSSVVYDNLSISGGSVSENTAKNTDGWDTYRSDAITIQNSVIDNGDDCVSFKPNSTNIVVQNLDCTGSHGISVGSLGQYPGTFDIVENILVTNTVMANASSGARIKVWPGASAALSGDLQGGGGSGRVRNITYDGFRSTNIDYVLEVTQCYGQRNQTLCDLYPSKLTIEDVWFKDFTGTSSAKYDPKAGILTCSSPDVCGRIHASGINITTPSGKPPVFDCTNVDESLLDLTCNTL
ncbi:putative exopolygalacturonase X [Geopyxis carbonaria]|nr:putative exopolygalacturonase X [Geopyxis carbonaria]